MNDTPKPESRGTEPAEPVRWSDIVRAVWELRWHMLAVMCMVMSLMVVIIERNFQEWGIWFIIGILAGAKGDGKL